MPAITKLSSWVNLKKHQVYLRDVKIADLFDDDEMRQANFSLESLGMVFDASRSRVDDKAMKLLYRLAEQRDVMGQLKSLFHGDRINASENKSVLHWMWRCKDDAKVIVDQRNIMPTVVEVRQKMKSFCDDFRSGKIVGATGKKILDIVHVGIGGSMLGVQTVLESLKKEHQLGVRVHFVSNIVQLTDLMYKLSVETTLFMVASKSFKTPEIVELVENIQGWIDDRLGEGSSKSHLVAMTATVKEAKRYGIKDSYVFPFSNSVGGRFSVWSSVGLTIALVLGWEKYEAFLVGGRSVDEMVQHDPIELNLSVRMALLSIWYRNFWQAQAQCVVPYASRMKTFVSYLQQLEMESNGKAGDDATAPIIFGDIGTEAEHSFFQALHQGTSLTPTEMILFADERNELAQHALVQAEFLAFGKKKTKQTPVHEICMGNHPAHLLMVKEFSPYTLGQLMAIYEYKVIVEGFVWGINSFDQFGIEAGKESYRSLKDDDSSSHQSTRQSFSVLKGLRS